jgi:heptosyltransferase-2
LLNDFSKILIIRFSSFGDIVLTFPLIKILKSKLPRCKIHFLTSEKYAQLAGMNPYIDKIISYSPAEPLGPLREKVVHEEEYDIILDLHKNFRSLYLTLFSGIETRRYKKQSWKKFLLVEFKINKFEEVIPVYKKYLLTVEDILSPADYSFSLTPLKAQLTRTISERYIVIAPSSRHFNKTYPKEKFLNVIHGIKGYKVALTGDGSKRDTEICTYLESNSSNVINLCGKLSFEELTEVLYNAEYVICNDSGVLHLAEAAGKKVYAIFGATVKEFGFFPRSTHSEVFENKELPCRPCTHVGLPGCPKYHFKCMNDLEIKINENDTPYLS